MTTPMDQVRITRYGSFTLAGFAVILLAAASHPALAQAPAAPKAVDASSAQITTLKTAVRRVAVDVVVTDSKGRPVTGLTQDDFRVAEDNKAQSVLFFDVHSVMPETNFIAPRIR